MYHGIHGMQLASFVVLALPFFGVRYSGGRFLAHLVFQLVLTSFLGPPLSPVLGTCRATVVLSRSWSRVE